MSTADVITRAALDLFYRQGFHASGVEQLSQSAGVTKKTLYRHFPSKEHVVEAALQLRHAEFMGQMARAVEGFDHANRPQAYIDFIIQWVQSADFHGCAFINASAFSNADPAALLQTFFAGQPMLISIICAPSSTLALAASASICASPPAICTERGSGSPS